MRSTSECFKGFCTMVDEDYGHCIHEEDYSVDAKGYICNWSNKHYKQIAEVYERAWCDGRLNIMENVY